MRATRPALPAVVTSASLDLLPLLDALGMTRVARLVKPFELRDLRACIDAAG